MNAKGVPRRVSRRLRVLQRDHWTCRLCFSPIDPKLTPPEDGAGTIDHIVPLSRGGSRALSNLQAAHRICNSRKDDFQKGD